MTKIFKKLVKIYKIEQICVFLASGCLSVAINGGGGGGGGLNRWALSVYLVFEDERSKASHEKSVKRKIA